MLQTSVARATTYPPPVVQGEGGAPRTRIRMRKTQSVSMGVLFKTAGSRIRKAQSAVGLFKTTTGSDKSGEAMFKIKEAKQKRVLQKALKKEEKKTKKAEEKKKKIDA